MKRLQAALILFTRLPFWRVFNPPKSAYERATDCWAVTGLLTGAVTAFAYMAAATIFSAFTAVVIALIARLVLTGAMHDDGLADFFDAFGGSASSEKMLAIMKDSHIGTYGVLALVSYYALCVAILSEMPVPTVTAVIFASDAWSKFCASQVINTLPYARREEEAKIKVIYHRMSAGRFSIGLTAGILALFIPAITDYASLKIIIAGAISSALAAMLLIYWIRRRLGGYTGDCCGALFLLAQLAFFAACDACERVLL